jgi:hypothetical protein
MMILAIDLSLAKTGMAKMCTCPLREWNTRTLKPPAKIMKLAGHDRLAWILGEIEAAAVGVTVAAIEGPAYHVPAGGQRGHHERAGLWWMVTHMLWTKGVDTVVIPPDSVKLYAAGKGGAEKDTVLVAAAHAFGESFTGDNNAADALWMAQMTADHYGAPAVEVTQKARRAALDPLVWPELKPEVLA